MGTVSGKFISNNYFMTSFIFDGNLTSFPPVGATTDSTSVVDFSVGHKGPSSKKKPQRPFNFHTAYTPSQANFEAKGQDSTADGKQEESSKPHEFIRPVFGPLPEDDVPDSPPVQSSSPLPLNHALDEEPVFSMGVPTKNKADGRRKVTKKHSFSKSFQPGTDSFGTEHAGKTHGEVETDAQRVASPPDVIMEGLGTGFDSLHVEEMRGKENSQSSNMNASINQEPIGSGSDGTRTVVFSIGKKSSPSVVKTTTAIPSVPTAVHDKLPPFQRRESVDSTFTTGNPPTVHFNDSAPKPFIFFPPTPPVPTVSSILHQNTSQTQSQQQQQPFTCTGTTVPPVTIPVNKGVNDSVEVSEGEEEPVVFSTGKPLGTKKKTKKPGGLLFGSRKPKSLASPLSARKPQPVQSDSKLDKGSDSDDDWNSSSGEEDNTATNSIPTPADTTTATEKMGQSTVPPFTTGSDDSKQWPFGPFGSSDNKPTMPVVPPVVHSVSQASEMFKGHSRANRRPSSASTRHPDTHNTGFVFNGANIPHTARDGDNSANTVFRGLFTASTPSVVPIPPVVSSGWSVSTFASSTNTTSLPTTTSTASTSFTNNKPTTLFGNGGAGAGTKTAWTDPSESKFGGGDGVFTTKTVPPIGNTAKTTTASSTTTSREPKETPQEVAQRHRVRGNDLFKHGKYAESVECYASALAAVPKDQLSLANKAAAHLMLDQFWDAAHCAEEAVEIQPTLVKAISRACRAWIAVGHTKKARDMAKRLPPDSTDGDSEEVRQIAAKIGQFESKLSDARMYLIGKREGEAFRFAEEACALYPEDHDAHIVKMKAMLALRKFGEVVTLARTLLLPSLGGSSRRAPVEIISSQQVEVYTCYVTAMWCSEGTEKAQKVVDSYPCWTDVPSLRDVSVLMSRCERLKLSGNEAFNSKDYDAAIKAYSKAIGLLESSCNYKLRCIMYANRVAALMAQGKYKDAIADSTAALRLDSRHVKVRLRRARCHVQLEHYDQAVRDFEQAIGDMKTANAPAGEVDAVREECKTAKDRKAEKTRQQQREKQQQQQQQQQERSYSSTPQPPPTSSSSSYQSKPDATGGAGGRKPQQQQQGRSTPFSPPPPPPQRTTEPPFPNHYSILGLPDFTPTGVEIKKAYHKMALKYHPDKVGTKSTDDGVSPLDVERANAVFKQVGEAYSVLSDATSKSRFDRELREHYASQTRVHMGGGAGGVYYTSTHSFNTSSFTSSFYGGGRGRSRRY